MTRSDQQSNKQEDQRKHPRKPCSVVVEGASWDSAFNGCIKNVGGGGVFIETPSAFAVGEEITLTFSSPNHEEPIKIVGEIVWNVPHGIGVKFKSSRQQVEAMTKSLP
jgi:Tfp pilus assembly protein PilZ